MWNRCASSRGTTASVLREGAVMHHEAPAQIVELHAYRICRHPVSNAEYLSFMLDGLSPR